MATRFDHWNGCRIVKTSLPPNSKTVKHTFEDGMEIYEPYDPAKGLSLDPNFEIFNYPEMN